MKILPAVVDDAAEILALQKLAYASEAALYGDETLPPLMQSLEQLQAEPTMFKPATRKALQTELAEKGFYDGPIDGDFGLSTQKALAAAFGLSAG